MRRTWLVLGLPMVAVAGDAPLDVDIVEAAVVDDVYRVEVAQPLTPDQRDEVLERLSGEVPPEAGGLQLVDSGGPPAVVPPVPAKPGEGARGAPIDHLGRWEGWLSGRAVYLSQCHGLIWYETLDRFSTQRGNVYDTVEDFHNPEGANQYLARYLENAGAAVFTVKERDLNPLMAIADNDGEGYDESGTGFADGGAGFVDDGPLAYDANPFQRGTNRVFPADGGAVASWIPEVPEAGSYALYVSWKQGPDRARDAHYRITHPGGVIDRHFDQTAHGQTWQYVDTLWLDKGVDDLVVELIGDSTDAGRVVSADAVRIGGGTGVVSRHGETTGRPRWEEGAVLATQFNGAPASVYDPYRNGDGSDPSSRSRWAAWEHPTGEDAVFLSWHSNATSDGSARGTVTYAYHDADAVVGSRDLSQAVQDELADVFQTLWEPGWYDRGVKTAAFSELEPAHNPEMPATLVELAFHDNATDVEYLKQPEFRRDAARAMYRGIVRYFAERDGDVPTFLPEPPQGVATLHDETGRLVVSWVDGLSGEPWGDPATSWVVETSSDGRAWGGGFEVGERRAVLDTAPDQTVFVRVSAVNPGGISFPSEVVGAHRSWDGGAGVLVVAAFDRLDTGLLDWVTPGFGLGTVRRFDAPHANPFDLVVAHGDAIDAVGWPWEAIADERLPDVDLSHYAVVIWATGEESTVDETFSAAQQAAIRSFVEGGGRMWVSGAEVLWDLDFRGSDDDRAFAAEVLGAAMADDDAQTDRAAGTGLLDGIGLDFGTAHGGPYPVEWPDVLASDRDVVARYDSGDVAAVLGGGVAMFGFPFEAIGDVASRRAVAAALLPALAPDYVPPVEPDPDNPEHPDDPRVRIADLAGCGCSAGAMAPGWLVWLGVAVVGWRRRTRR